MVTANRSASAPLSLDPSCAGSTPHPTPTTIASSEAELLRAAAAGDKTAFGCLYDRQVGPIYSLVIRMVGPSSAEDIVQESFLQVWLSAAHFDPAKASCFAWMATIARRKAIDHLRSGIVRRQNTEDVSNVAAHPVSSCPGLVAEETHSILQHALAVLSVDERAAIVLAYFKEHTHLQIAEALDAPVGTIKSRIRRGLTRLKGSLSGTELGLL